MKQFELKFYREWFDALSELSHEQRANAVLSLLEYVYENKLPEDKFIRIVTTLMRNKIDREKAAHNRAVERKEQKEDVANNNNDLGTSQEKTDSTSDIQNQFNDNLSPYLTQNEIDKYSIPSEYVNEINTIISLRSNPQDPNFIKLSNNNKVNPIVWAARFKSMIIDMVAHRNFEPFRLPENSKSTFFRQLRTQALKTISRT